MSDLTFEIRQKKKISDTTIKIMEKFEKDMKDGNCVSFYVKLNFKKDNSNVKGVFYEDGEINKLFKIYYLGYSYGIYEERS